MKKIIFMFFVSYSIISINAFHSKALAQSVPRPTQIPEIHAAPENSPMAFGTLAGVAYACEAGKDLDNFELIVSRILVNTAPNKKMEQAYLQEYAQAKKTAMIKQSKNPPMSCAQFLKEFSKQKIFQSMVMSDGSVKNPDGSWSLPRGQKSPPAGY